MSMVPSTPVKALPPHQMHLYVFQMRRFVFVLFFLVNMPENEQRCGRHRGSRAELGRGRGRERGGWRACSRCRCCRSRAAGLCRCKLTPGGSSCSRRTRGRVCSTPYTCRTQMGSKKGEQEVLLPWTARIYFFSGGRGRARGVCVVVSFQVLCCFGFCRRHRCKFVKFDD